MSKFRHAVSLAILLLFTTLSIGGGSPQGSRPSPDLIGRSHEGKEWLEWPEGSDNHFYRELGFGGDCTRYE